jgi:hypothetical protein
VPERLARRYLPVVPRGALSDFVDDLQAGGRLTFTREEAMAVLGLTQGALKQAALRLSKRGRLVAPRRGFFVIIPLEFRARGAPPPARWVPELVRFHGARDQATEEEGDDVLVTVDRPIRPARCGPYEVSFKVAR